MPNRSSPIQFFAVMAVRAVLDTIFAPFLFLFAVLARFVPAPVEVGLGPTPIINNPYHKIALEKFGHRAEIFVDTLWYYTKDYDYAPWLLLKGPLRAFAPYWLAMRTFFRYRTLYTYYDGGPLRSTAWLFLFEPFLLKVAGVKTVIMPFGADVHDLRHSPDRYLVHAYGRDYPTHRFLGRRISRKIDLWTAWADHIIGGCDWIHYQPYWDTLMISHFVIDADRVRPSRAKAISPEGAPLRLLHAPNHRTLKGTDFLLQAVEELQGEGLEIEVTLLQKKPNAEVLEAIEQADIVVDQLIIGWYAMFAIEAMALETPCICYIDDELLKVFSRAGLLKNGECPLISATPETIKEKLRELYSNREELRKASRQSRAYIERHHSPEAVGKVFDTIQKSLR